MGLFLSTTVNRIDRKGRVSVPGPFRATLAQQNHQGIVLIKSPLHAALEGFAPTLMEDIATRLDAFPMFSSEQDDLAATTLAEAVPLAFDSEGRIILPAELLAHANIRESVAFIGMGRKFQIWEPKAWQSRRNEAQNAVKTKGLVLPRKAETP